MPFKKGDPNINKKGRPKRGFTFKETLEMEAQDYIAHGAGHITKMQAIAKILWKKASEGDIKAIDMLMDRIDGKPKQIVEAEVKTIQVNLDPEEASEIV